MRLKRRKFAQLMLFSTASVVVGDAAKAVATGDFKKKVLQEHPNNRVIMCAKVFQTCPVGVHTVSPCSHKVNCFTGEILG